MKSRKYHRPQIHAACGSQMAAAFRRNELERIRHLPPVQLPESHKPLSDPTDISDRQIMFELSAIGIVAAVVMIVVLFV